MNAVIIATGSELLSPDRVDTNSLFITEKLEGIGVNVTRKIIIGDDREEIVKTVSEEFRRADILFVTGGLGPTADDITVEASASAFGLKLTESSEVAEKIRGIYERRNTVPSAEAMKMALYPEGFEVLDNPVGTAPGLFGDYDGKKVVILPGVPEEMKAIMVVSVLPRLAKSCVITVRKVLKAAGIYESKVNDLIFAEQPAPGVVTGICAEPGVIRIILKATAPEEEAFNKINAEEERARKILGDHVFTSENEEIEHVVIRMLSENKCTVSAAESCTGGLIAEKLTSVPGSSVCFAGSITAYTETAKTNLLDLDRELIEKYGVVSFETATAMSDSVKKIFSTDFGISTTGYAGPDSAERIPTGTVFISVSTDIRTVTEECHFRGDRDEVRLRAARKALDMLRIILLESSSC